jgi:membrane protein YdbS with pleckstrin-like domain
MYELLRLRMLALLKVPHEPHPPMGDPASLQVFRAGRNYYKLRLATWTAAQVLALGGIIFWAVILIDVEAMADTQRIERATRPATITTPAGQGKTTSEPSASTSAKTRPNNLPERLKMAAEAKGGGMTGFKQIFVELALMMPLWAFPLIWGLKILSFFIYLLQIPITYAVRRLDYEMRWYMVTDRSLRLRHGVWKVSESTMSFANIQQVVVSHGPLQRLMGLADVKVQSAGGGGEKDHEQGEDMHLGLFHSVTNASEIRDLILDRLRRFRESGLGNPDEASHASLPDVPVPANAPVDTLAAAHELLTEARKLRTALS